MRGKRRDKPCYEKEELEKITVANWSQPITEATNLLVDENKGFFKEKGIDLTVIPAPAVEMQSKMFYQEKRILPLRILDPFILL